MAIEQALPASGLRRPVVPAPAGTHAGQRRSWIPASAGMALLLILQGCAVQPHAPEPAPSPPPLVAASAAPAPAPALAAPAPAAIPPAAPPASAPLATTTLALAYADRLRTLSAAELAAEITQLSASPATPLRQMQLVLALVQTQSAADAPRIQALLQNLLATDTEAGRSLHPLARLVAGQWQQQRKLEEQVERQAAQLRDGQRRNEQLSERLEALRAIERSLPVRPAPRTSR